MKRFGIRIFAIAMIVMLCALGLAACTQKSYCELHGHDWDEENIEITVEPICKQGEGIKTCKKCGITEPVVLPAQHNLRPDFNKTKVATCNKEGLDVKICRDCSTTIETPIAPLGHDFTGTSVITKEATCEDKGERQVKCNRKNCDGDEHNNIPAVLTTEIPKLGHDWQQEKTLDKEPTFTDAGSRSLHCSRCENKKDEEVIPKLVKGEPVEYRFRIARPNHEIIRIGLADITVTIKDKTGKTVAVSSRENFANGIMTVKLDPDDYTAEIEGLPAGYTAQPNYTINPGSIDKDLVVNASLLPVSDASENTKYSLGSVMHDYTFKDVNGKTVTLSSLLEQKKMVLLNFFFVTCGACQSEMPGLISAYNIYKEDMAVVMLDVYPTDTVDSIKKDFLDPFKVPDSIYAVQDITPNGASASEYNNICEKFGFQSAPQNVIIDREGVVAFMETGSTSDMQFRAMFKKYTTAPYYF